MSDSAKPLQSIGNIASYHAHIYYDVAATRDEAAILRQQIGERFTVRLGNWYDKPIGPHSQPMYQVAFAVEVFPRLVPWLMLNRRGLVVLVHPNTGRPLDDHLVHALWLGEKLPVNYGFLPEKIDIEEEPEMQRSNTQPTVAAI
ncbi:MAG: DOPA 4,5-dioxygenase family protein [Dongiaceae bacterium]